MVSVEDIYTILELMKPFEWINVTFHNPNGLFVVLYLIFKALRQQRIQLIGSVAVQVAGMLWR